MSTMSETETVEGLTKVIPQVIGGWAAATPGRCVEWQKEHPLEEAAGISGKGQIFRLRWNPDLKRHEFNSTGTWTIDLWPVDTSFSYFIPTPYCWTDSDEPIGSFVYFETMEEALADGRACFPDRTIIVWRRVEPKEHITRFSVAEELVEMIDLRMAEDSGAEDVTITLPADKMPGLDQVIREYLTQHMECSGYALLEEVHRYDPAKESTVEEISL